MEGNCRLCWQKSELVESHIIPSFVYRWLKETSVTGHLRFGETVNKRVQDGIKTYLLCSDCEGLFGEWENDFARRVFVPLHENKPIGNYGPRLLKFSTSVTWRALTYFKESLDLNHFSHELQLAADNALDGWREFLLDRRRNPDGWEQHLIPFRGFISENSDPDLPGNFNRYVSRTVDIDAACSKTQAYVYAKMCRILLIGFIQIEHKGRWRDTKIHLKSGTLVKQRYKIPVEIGSFMYYKARKLQGIMRSMSGRQWDKVGQDYRKNSGKFAGSEMYRALDRDFLLSGNDAFDG